MRLVQKLGQVNVIRWMRNRAYALPVLGFLAIDFVATFAIGVSTFLIVFSVVSLPRETETIWAVFREIIFPLSAPKPGNSTLGIFFYSTFFTSVWVWLYAFSGLVVKLAGYLGIGFNRLKWFLDIENKPLHSLGIISMLLVTLLYLVGAGFYRLVGSY